MSYFNQHVGVRTLTRSKIAIISEKNSFLEYQSHFVWINADA